MTTNIFSPPSFDQLSARIGADLSTVPEAIRGPMGAALAHAVMANHLHIEQVGLDIHPATCSELMLPRWAGLYSVAQLPATKASGLVMVVGTAGAVVLTGALFRGSNGLDYEALAPSIFAVSATATVQVRCTTLGPAGNLPAGAELVLVDTVAGVQSTATVSNGGIDGGAEAEAVESWRSRVVAAFEATTALGARTGRVQDYVFWARTAHPSVSTALVAGTVGAVTVWPVCNSLPSRLSTAAINTAIHSYLAHVAPAEALITIAEPAVRQLTVELALQSVVNVASTREALTHALRQLIEKTEPVGAAYPVITVAEVDQALATVTTAYTRTAPTANWEFGAGQVPVLGTVTYI